MVAMLHDRPVAWAPPSPFWSDADRATMRRPAILRFATDDFMQELQRILARDPGKLRAQVTVPETWRGIRKPARTPNPRAGQGGLFARLGVAARRGSSPRTPAPAVSKDALQMDLKLYQPAHQRFYLVASCLVCQQAGLPDRKIDVGQLETASFVVRRWFPLLGSVNEALPDFDPMKWVEHAFVAQADGSLAWVPVAEAGAAESKRAIVLADEERLPLFPVSFSEDDGRSRRLLAGLVPVGKREAYHAAMRPASDGSPGGVTKNTARIALFRKLVSEPWKAIVEQGRAGWKGQNTEPVKALKDIPLPAKDPGEIGVLKNEVRSRIQLASYFVLADLASFLQTYLPTVYDAVARDLDSAAGKANDVLQMLRQTSIGVGLIADIGRPSASFAASMKDALRVFTGDAHVLEALEQTSAPYIWPGGGNGHPTFLFPLSDSNFPLQAARPKFVNVTEDPDPEIGPDPTPPPPPPPLPNDSVFDDYKKDIDRFAAVVIRALETLPDQPEPAVPTAAERPADLRDGWFHLRCVYERPVCGPLHHDVVSVPSERFKLAGFFDPDAPARPIRIGLPIDTTPAGLRKFDKNTAFVMSDVLCGQVNRVKSLTLGDLVLSVLPWPFHKDLPNPETGPCKSGTDSIGMICSLSIPIITICALILLIIMVAVLDFIFKWIPFLMVCFPIPGLRAKK